METVSIFCPISESIAPLVFQSAVSMAAYAAMNGVHIQFIGVTERTLVDRARNILATEFLKTDSDWSFWMDADMVCHSPISHAFLEQMVPAAAGAAFLGRRKKYTETGLYALNLTQAPTLELVDLMQGSYERAEQDLFLMPEWHDCQVFDEKRAIIQRRYPDWQQINWSEHLVMGEGHPLVNTAWRDYLDHLKGDRKSMGRSKRKDMVEASTHHYWNQR